MIGAWRQWAFEPMDTAPMAALRIACGLLALGWTLSLLPDASTFLASDGVLPEAGGGTSGWWTLPLGSHYGALALLAAAAVALTLGWHTRLAAIVVAVGLIAVQRRNVFVLNSGDLLLREMAIFVALMPAGERWSLDARGRRPQPRAPWGLRLLQLQVSALYLFSVVTKLGGTTWQDGTAVGRTQQLDDLQRIALPDAITTSLTVSAIATYGTLVIEGLLVFALWLPRLRWPAMALGTALHLGIEATMLIGWFSFTIISCYLAFVPPDVLERVVARVRGRLPAWARRESGASSPRAASAGSPRATARAGGRGS